MNSLQLTQDDGTVHYVFTSHITAIQVDRINSFDSTLRIFIVGMQVPFFSISGNTMFIDKEAQKIMKQLTGLI